MKKTAAAILTIALCAAMSVNAFAASGGKIAASPKESSHDVSAKLIDSSESPTVYSVDIIWGKMQFTYTRSGRMEWDGETHRYLDQTTGAWSADGGSNTVSVVNHSNMGIKAELTSTLNPGFRGSFRQADFALPSAVGTAYENAPSAATTFSITGGEAGTADFTRIGTLTITIKN